MRCFLKPIKYSQKEICTLSRTKSLLMPEAVPMSWGVSEALKVCGHVCFPVPEICTVPRPQIGEPVFGLMVGMPQLSVDMGMLIGLSPPPTIDYKHGSLSC